MSNRNGPSVARAAVLIAIAVVTSSVAQAAQFSIEAVKAAYLFRFAQYIAWPEAPADAPFVIAVTGAEGVAAHLERLVPGMKINGRVVTVRRVTRAPELDGVSILFVSDESFARSRALRGIAISKPILIVTETPDGLDGGGVINFIEVDRNLRFEVSLIAADRSGLRIDPALLSVAARVERRPQGAIGCVDGYSRPRRDGKCQIRLANLDVRSGR